MVFIKSYVDLVTNSFRRHALPNRYHDDFPYLCQQVQEVDVEFRSAPVRMFHQVRHINPMGDGNRRARHLVNLL